MALNWGIIGMGDIADRVMAPAMAQACNNRLVAVMRRDRKKAEELAHKHGAQRSYGSVQEILCDDGIDAVYIATPVSCHANQTIEAAEHGKHVLCEKPMAMTVEEAEAMVTACEAHNVKLMVCYYQRFNRRHQQIRKLLQTEAIGQVTALRLSFCSLGRDDPTSWRQDPAIGGGGNLMDCGSHCVDLLRFLVGEPHAVSAFVDTLAFSYPVDDTATMLLKLESGAHAVISAHWSTLVPGEQDSSSLAIYGTEGAIYSAPLHDKHSRGTLKLMTRSEQRQYCFEQSTHVALLEAFAGSIEADSQAPISGYDGLRASQIIAAGYESARSGRVVPVVPP